MQINVERLLGTKVRDVDGEEVGRIEEIRVDRTPDALLVDAYLIGASALIQRLSAWTLVRPIKHVLHTRHIYSLYEVPWKDMDLTDPKKPTLRVAKHHLRRAR
ncbi:MAG: PRC-barrel domain-containing protein [Gemmatimonadaceae bacterium]